jgi:hypothetical protein
VSPTGKLAHEHGWEVPLTCPRCGVEAEPACRGWAPNHAIHFGKTPTVFMNVSCAGCGADLRGAAGNKLVELFGDVATNATNRWLIAALVIYFLLILPLLLWAAIRFPAARGLEGLIAVGHVLLIHPIMLWFNHRVAALRQSCACGKPRYKFLGMLGRSYCYRCSTCGQLLRLRD